MDRILKGNMHEVYDRGMEALAKSRQQFVELVRECGKNIGLGFSLHFSKSKKMFYETIIDKVSLGWSTKPLELLTFICNERWDRLLTFLSSSAQAIFSGLKEYHIPNYEFTQGGQIRRKNPCQLDCHSDMLMDYKNTVQHFNEKKVPPTEIAITEHVGYRKRDGEKIMTPYFLVHEMDLRIDKLVKDGLLELRQIRMGNESKIEARLLGSRNEEIDALVAEGKIE
ncbi:MAG: hypothetical protein WC759_01885, partial [Candidatus Micrarchaeia archaeon]